MKTIHLALATAASAFAFATAANAVTETLMEGTGWHYGESHAAGSSSMYNYDGSGSTVQFTLKADVVSPTDDLSFVDGYIPGDAYNLSITITGQTATTKTQFLDASNFNPIPDILAGPYGSTFGPDWLQTNGDGTSIYGHAQVELTPGIYTVTVKDICGARGEPTCPGFPAGWGIRLDAVPDASTWALMLVGSFGLGAALRGRRRMATA